MKKVFLHPAIGFAGTKIRKLMQVDAGFYTYNSKVINFYKLMPYIVYPLSDGKKILHDYIFLQGLNNIITYVVTA